MPAAEFRDWLQYEAEEPFLPQRSDWQTALLAFLMRRSLGDKTAKLDQFVLFGNNDIQQSAAPDAKKKAEQIAAEVHSAMMKASSRVKMRVIKRRK
jgi:hypothetical protein